MLCEWWSFYRSPAANSFHLPNSRWLRLRLLFSFPHGLVSPCVIFERRVCFWFNFQITGMWEHYGSSHVSLKTQLTYLFFSLRETCVSYNQGGYMVIHLSGMHPLKKIYVAQGWCVFSLRLFSQIRVSTWQLETSPLFIYFFMSSRLKRNNKLFNWCSKCSYFFQTTQISTYCFWFQTNGHSSEAVYQERLSRLESDKECLILQVCEKNSF